MPESTQEDQAALVDMNFKVPAPLRRRFKMEAALRQITMRELLERSFRCFIEHEPAQMPPDIFKS